MNQRTIQAASILGALTLSVFLPAASCWAAAAGVLTYQGRLKESGLPASGARSVDILLCDALTGGLCHDTGSQSVSVSSGLFRTTFTVPGTVDLTAGPWYLEIKIGALTLSPRELLTSSPYAVFASTAGSVVAGAIDTAKLAPDAVTAAAILNGAVTNSKIAAGAVDAAKIVAGAVTSLHLAAGAVDTGKIGGAAVGSSHIQAGAVDSSKLAAGAVDSGKLAANAVAGANIQAGAVDSSKLAAGAIDSGKLAANAVSAANIQAGAVDSSKLASGAVDSSKLAAGAVDTGKLAPAAVTAAALAAGSVANAHIQAGAIDSGKLTSNSVWASQIAPGAVDSTKLAAGAVDSAKLAANSVAGVHIQAGAVDSGKLAAGAVDSGKIALGAVDSTKLASDFTSLARVSGGLIVIGAADTTKIGIGTTLPTATLHIAAGGIRFPDNSLMNTAATGGSATNVDNPTDALINADSDVSGTGGVGLQIAGANKLFITNAGKVGIGSTDAAEAFDLSGAMVFRGMAAPGASNADQGKLYYDSAADKIKVSENGGVFTNLIGGAGGAVTLQGTTPGASDAGNINVTGTGLFGGNLGVGTASPASKLHVSGGDIRVGDATPSILSASGYLDMANLAAAPPAVPGRIYYDNTGDGALKVRLNSGGFLSVVAGSVDSGKLAAGAVGASHIQAGAVDSAKLAAGSVDSGKIAIGAVDSGKLAANSVWAPHLAAGSVDSTKLAAGSVDSNKLVAGAVDTAKIAAGVVDSSKLTSDFNSLARVSGGLIVISAADPGKVGIGTANPSEKLHVYANTPSANLKFEGTGANANPNIIVKAAGGGGNAGIVIDRSDTGGRSMLNWYNAGTMKWQFELPDFTSGDSDRLDLRNAAGTKVLTAKQTGNIGIGESIPATTLDVLGSAQFGTSATRSTFSATGALTLAKDSGLTLSGSGGTLASGSSITASAFFGNGSALTGINASDNTKVAKAGDAMSGDLTINAGLAVTNGAGVGAAGLTGGLLVVKSTTATAGHPALQVQNNAGTGLLRVQQDGSVGIGTTASATYELQVSKNSSSQLTAGTPLLWVENTNATPASGGNGNLAHVFVNAGNSSVGGGLTASSGFVGAGAVLNNNLVLRSITNHPIDIAPNDTFSARFTADGKVGIGTTGPGARLQVNHAEVDKGIDVQSALPRIRLTETDQVSPAGEYEFTSDGDSMRLYRGAIGSQTALLVVKGNGNVGIGTTSPAHALHVAGDINSTGGTGFMLGSRSSLAFGAAANDLHVGQGHAGYTRVYNQGSTVGAITLNNSRVGISTGSPSTLLDVQGDAQFGSGVLKSTFAAVPGITTYALSLSSGVTIANGGPLYLNSGGYIRFPDGTTQLSAGAIGSFVAKAGDSMTGNLNLAGGKLQAGGTDVLTATRLLYTADGSVGSPALAFSAETGLGLYRPGAGRIGFASGGSQRMMIDSNGNVGIGTTGPNSKLDVKGALEVGTASRGALITSDATDNFNIKTWANTPNPNFEIAIGDGAGGIATTWLHGNNVGYVGVGTNNPQEALDVSGNGIRLTRYITNAAGPYVYLNHANGTSAAPLIVQSGDQTGKIYFQGYDGGAYVESAQIQAVVDGTPGVTDMPGKLQFLTTPDGSNAGQIRLVINSAGNVGIGATSPGEKLEINGNLRFSGNANIYTTGGTGQLWLGGGSQGSLNLQTNNGAIEFYSGASGGTRIGVLSNAGNLQMSGNLSMDGTANSYLKGNVGIGITVPQGKLHVVSDGAGGQMIIDGTTAAPELMLRRDQVLSNGNTITRMLLQGKDAGGTMRNFWDVNTVATDVTAGAQKGDLVLTSYTGMSPSERMRITQAGSIGIGTSMPTARLHVVPAAGQNAVRVVKAGGGAGSIDLFSIVTPSNNISPDQACGNASPNSGCLAHFTAAGALSNCATNVNANDRLLCAKMGD